MPKMRTKSCLMVLGMRRRHVLHQPPSIASTVRGHILGSNADDLKHESRQNGIGRSSDIADWMWAGEETRSLKTTGKSVLAGGSGQGSIVGPASDFPPLSSPESADSAAGPFDLQLAVSELESSGGVLLATLAATSTLPWL